MAFMRPSLHTFRLSFCSPLNSVPVYILTVSTKIFAHFSVVLPEAVNEDSSWAKQDTCALLKHYVFLLCLHYFPIILFFKILSPLQSTYIFPTVLTGIQKNVNSAFFFTDVDLDSIFWARSLPDIRAPVMHGDVL